MPSNVADDSDHLPPTVAGDVLNMFADGILTGKVLLRRASANENDIGHRIRSSGPGRCALEHGKKSDLL